MISNQSRCYYYYYLFLFYFLVAIGYLSNGCCIFIWWLLCICLAIMGIILFKRDRIKGSKFRALDNRPWKRTMGLVGAWDHQDFGKWGYHVFCWRVGLHVFCLVRVVATTFVGLWDYHIFCLVRGVATTFVSVWDYHDFCLVCGITTTLCVWVYHNLMYVWLLFVCVHGFMCVGLSQLYVCWLVPNWIYVGTRLCVRGCPIVYKCGLTALCVWIRP